MTWLKAIGWTIAFVLLGTVLAVLLALGGQLVATGAAAPGALAGDAASVTSVLLTGLASLVAFGLATWTLGHRGLGLHARDLRWHPARLGVPGFGRGLLLGIAAAAAALGLAALLGGAAWSDDRGTVSDYALRVAALFLTLAPAALAEEVIFRGLPLVLLAALLGRAGAVALVATAFALAHLANPNVSALALVNIALAGLMLGAAFYAPGGIWTAWGAHLGWNGALAALDAPVSGLPFTIPLLDYHAGGPAWVTGGAFGPEGGIAATIAISLATLAAGRWTRKEQA